MPDEFWLSTIDWQAEKARMWSTNAMRITAQLLDGAPPAMVPELECLREVQRDLHMLLLSLQPRLAGPLK